MIFKKSYGAFKVEVPLLVGHLYDESNYNYLHYIFQINNFSFTFFNFSEIRIRPPSGEPDGPWTIQIKMKWFLHTIASSGQNKTETLISSPLFLFLYFGSSQHFLTFMYNRVHVTFLNFVHFLGPVYGTGLVSVSNM